MREQELIQRLINCLGCDTESEKHNNIAQFICDIISHSRTFRQNDLVERGVKKAGDDASLSLLYALEDEQITKSLLDIILLNSTKESTVAAGIKIILKLLEKSFM